MAEKKNEEKKTVAKKAPVKAQANTKAKAPVKAQANTKAKAPVQKEEVYPAISIANIFGIPSFAFYMIKEAKNINDGTLLTMSEFQRYYNEVVEGR